MTDHIALIGSTGFFEVFEPAPSDEKNSYNHFPAGTYHWSDRLAHGGVAIIWLDNGWTLTISGARITKDEKIRELARIVERL